MNNIESEQVCLHGSGNGVSRKPRAIRGIRHDKKTVMHHSSLRRAQKSSTSGMLDGPDDVAW